MARTLGTIALVLVAFLLFVMLPGLAFAADGTAVDFSPILTQLVLLAALAIGGLGSIAIGYMIAGIRAWLKKKDIDVTDATAAKWNAALQNALGFAVERTAGITADMIAKGSLSMDVKSPLLANGLGYLIEHEPDVLKAVGVMKSNGTVDGDIIKRALEARIGLASLSTATSPVSAGAAMATSPAPSGG